MKNGQGEVFTVKMEISPALSSFLFSACQQARILTSNFSRRVRGFNSNFQRFGSASLKVKKVICSESIRESWSDSWKKMIWYS
jgi:hypothetical protein